MTRPIPNAARSAPWTQALGILLVVTGLLAALAVAPQSTTSKNAFLVGGIILVVAGLLLVTIPFFVDSFKWGRRTGTGTSRQSIVAFAVGAMLLVGGFTWTAGYFARSPNSRVSDSAPLYLVAAGFYVLVAGFVLATKLRNLHRGPA